MEISAVLIAGPTASGKSAIAIDLARRLGGAIINTDSMQIYRDLPIITAQPTEADCADVPHRLYGVLDAAENFSVGRWLTMAGDTLTAVRNDKLLPIFVGGTGLYFKALTEGLADIPDIPESVRREARSDLDVLGHEAFFTRLQKADPDTAARISANDEQRVVRAWSVYRATGTPISVWQLRNSPPLLTGPMRRIVVSPERARLYRQIDRRFDAMIERGAVAEVRQLAARGLSPRLPAMRALGVPQIIGYLDGLQTLDEASEYAKTASRRYAKRQMTWFRNQMISWKSFSTQDSERLKEEIFNFVIN